MNVGFFMDIYVLKSKDGNLLPPSIQATTLAKYSRSSLSAKDIINTLTNEEANKFHSKWTISYGHSSVAELAVIPICFEGISIIASKFIEKYQRAGYSEKSTRYQYFSKDSFINPLPGNTTLTNFAKRYYEAYDEMHHAALDRAACLIGTQDINENRVKARAFDSLRYLLPAGTGTNLACVINLRDLRYLISEALGHKNPEIRTIGAEVLKCASELCPSLLGGIEPDNFEPRLKAIIPDYFVKDKESVKILNCDLKSFEKMKKYAKSIYGMEWGELNTLMNKRGNRRTVEIFRLVDFTLEIIMDYGAYRDLQRHRRCEQFPEPLTTYYGYSVPDDFVNTPLEEKYRNVMDQLLNYEEDTVIHDNDIYQYIIPMGYLHRSIFKMDLAELYYITELRTKPQGHISYRRIAFKMFEEVNNKFPELMQWCNAISPDEIGDHL